MSGGKNVDSRPFVQLVWQQVDPDTHHGPQLAVLWGDPQHGAFGALLKVPAGFESPMHTHTLDERVVQMRGRSMHWTSDGTRTGAPVMEPGDYMLMPGGVPHVSATSGDESLELIVMDGPFDFIFHSHPNEATE